MADLIHVADAGIGNITSVINMLRRAGAEARATAEPEQIAAARVIVLPGVGSFDAGMNALRRGGMDAAIRQAAEKGARILGICLGMQLLLEGSDEGSERGLGFIPGKALRFDLEDKSLKVPHMGWNTVEPVRDSALFKMTDESQRFYFVHSYYASCTSAADVAAVAHHGPAFTCAVERENFLGVQFHPEKSHRFGLALLKRFAAL